MPASPPANLQPSRSAPRSRQRKNTAPSLLRLPSDTSQATSTASRSRRSSNPTTPNTLSHPPTTSPSYFSPQSAASGKDARSPYGRRPPASFSSNGIDNSRGPPITLISRGSRSQRPADFAFAQQQLLQLGLVSPGETSHSSGGHRRRRASQSTGDSTPQNRTPNLSRQNSAHAPKHMASSADGSSSTYESGMRSQSEDTQIMRNDQTANDTSSGSGEQSEDLFIAAAASTRDMSEEQPSRAERLRSRIAVRNNRQSLPSSIHSNATTPQASKQPSAADSGSAGQHRRASYFSAASRTQREQSPLSPSLYETPRSRLLDLSPKPSLTSTQARDKELSPQQFLSTISNRRPSQPDTLQTPPHRTQTYKPSNLHYSSSRNNQETPHIDTPQENRSRHDGTESLDDSTGPAASVWDELDDLKARLRRIEQGGKIPSTSAAAVANASAERPRTANTSATTVSSSPRQTRKTNDSSADSTVGATTSSKVHPLLKEALQQARQHVAPSIYRALEATAAEALTLAELAGSAGPQGTLHSVSSILTGAAIPDRQVRRKADNLCRNLTELCIALATTKHEIASPAISRVAATESRRPSVQVNGSPSIRTSIEAESDSIPPRDIPSRAMSRIEARRSSMATGGLANGDRRESSVEPPTPSQTRIPTGLTRAGTALHRTRQSATHEEDEDFTLRAPSRAMTDFRDIRQSDNTRRFSRDFTSRPPMPELQPSPALQSTLPARRPTVSGAENSHLPFRNVDTSRRFHQERQSSPAYEKQVSNDFRRTLTQPSNSSNRASLGASGLGRTGSLSRRLRGASTGE